MRNILIHARGSFGERELMFWERLSETLGRLNLKLWLIAHNRPDRIFKVPLLIVPNNTNSVDIQLPPLGWSTVGDLPVNEELLKVEEMWRGAPENLTSRVCALQYFESFYKMALLSIRPSLIVIWNGHHAQEKILNRLAKENHCPVVFVERSPIAGMIQFDELGVIAGSSPCLQSTFPFVEDAKWKKAYEEVKKSYARGDSTWWEQPIGMRGKTLRERVGAPSEKKIVLFAGQVDDDIQNHQFSPLFKDNFEAFKFFCRLMEDREDVFILGKHHPKSRVDPCKYREIVKGMGCWLDDVSINDCLDVADLVATVNSTVIFEALFRNKVALTLGKSLVSGKSICFEIDDFKEVSEVVEDWVSQSLLKERIMRWEQYCQYLMAVHFFEFSSCREIGLNGAEECASWLEQRTCRYDLSYSSLEVGIRDTLLLSSFQAKWSRNSLDVLTIRPRLSYLKPILMSGKRIVVYGGGEHTKQLLSYFPEILNSNTVWKILDQKGRGETICGIEVVDAKEFKYESIECCLISSKAYEDEIYEWLLSKLDTTQIFRIYGA